MQHRPENSGRFERNAKDVLSTWLMAMAVGLVILLVAGVCLSFLITREMDSLPAGQVAGMTETGQPGDSKGTGQGQGNGSGDSLTGMESAEPQGSADGLETDDATEIVDIEIANEDQPTTEEVGVSRIDLENATPTKPGLIDETIENPQPEIPALAGKAAPLRKGTSNPALQGKTAPKSIFADKSSKLAKRIVYVIDSSGSMRGGRLDLAKKELVNSLKGLEKSQKFYVIFFSSGATEMSSGRMLPAVPLNRKKTEDWLRKIKPSGGTRVAAAMEIAVSKDPDLIWLLTDGEIRDPLKAQKVLDDYRRKNPNQKFKLNTISFIEPKGAKLLRHLARKYGGSYKFVAK